MSAKMVRKKVDFFLFTSPQGGNRGSVVVTLLVQPGLDASQNKCCSDVTEGISAGIFSVLGNSKSLQSEVKVYLNATMWKSFIILVFKLKGVLSPIYQTNSHIKYKMQQQVRNKSPGMPKFQ